MKKIELRNGRAWEEWAARRRAESPESVTKISKSRVWFVIALVPAVAFIFISTFLDFSGNTNIAKLSWISFLPENIPLIRSVRSFIADDVISFDIIIRIAVVYGFFFGLFLATLLAYSLIKSRFSTLCEAFRIKPYFLPFLILFSSFLILATFINSGPESVSELSKFSRLALGNALELSFYGYMIFLSAGGFVLMVLGSLQIVFLWFLCLLRGE